VLVKSEGHGEEFVMNVLGEFWANAGNADGEWYGGALEFAIWIKNEIYGAFSMNYLK